MPFGTPLGPALASPEVTQGPPSPERNTILASPLADRIGGGISQTSQLPMLVNLVRKGLQAISVMLRDSDPKAAADVEQFAAKLLKLSVTAPVRPGAIPGMAAQLPGGPGMGGAGMPMGHPPMAVPGTGVMAGPLAGLR